MGGSALPYVVLCGHGPADPVKLVQDLGFGCLDSKEGTTETVRAWLQPMPAAWDAARTCAAQIERPFYKGLVFDTADAGDSGNLAGEPSADWARGSAAGTWRRDASPCGGALNVVMTLARP